MPLSLSEWETFYVITGSSGAALTSVMFVVIALAADRVPMTTQSGPTVEFSAFTTPTLVHLSAVLLVSSIVSIPHQTTLSLGIALGLCGLAGMIYSAVSIRRMHKLVRYKPVTEDWAWYAALPFAAYVALGGAAVALRVAVEVALDFVAAVVILLLFIGIHNAWDVAVFTATYRNTGVAAPADTSGAPATGAVDAETAPPGAT